MSTSRRFSITHESVFSYEQTIPGCVMLARLCPFNDRGQRLHGFGIRIDPEVVPVASDDGFGNLCHLFTIHRRHDRATLRSSAVVETTDPPALPDRLEAVDWDRLATAARSPELWTWLAPSRFARPGPALDGFVERNNIRPGPDPLTTLLETCGALYRSFTYAPGATTVNSEIDVILESSEGVCQDYTHVMIALARSWGIPGRYVSGYLHLEGVSGEQTPEGASHAWAEFWLPDLGWIGLDPTNNTRADHRHVRIAHGRDYDDAAPTRGAVLAGATARVTVAVIVDELDQAASPPPRAPEPTEQPRMTGLPWHRHAVQAPASSNADQ
ncbi:MAG: transglutaminase family protein [Alphaproteobacteria bacterium]|nr:transglutaminase family protein [Alphaproteobacteria bacterium]